MLLQRSLRSDAQANEGHWDMILVIAVGDGLQRFCLDLDLPRAIDKHD